MPKRRSKSARRQQHRLGPGFLIKVQSAAARLPYRHLASGGAASWCRLAASRRAAVSMELLRPLTRKTERHQQRRNSTQANPSSQPEHYTIMGILQPRALAARLEQQQVGIQAYTVQGVAGSGARPPAAGLGLALPGPIPRAAGGLHDCQIARQPCCRCSTFCPWTRPRLSPRRACTAGGRRRCCSRLTAEAPGGAGWCTSRSIGCRSRATPRATCCCLLPAASRPLLPLLRSPPTAASLALTTVLMERPNGYTRAGTKPET
ncbi:hypothetical protein PVAP13_7NG130700 [Panicum virgatum]|uniref:Uncharacterized protein n=1 Tax=Panicum virgatum TaxID=38727 RepID=A0A8T0Q6S1_PANVG|nr:hypothetical protein PVAP13_7NG130700 [Panicum virgatum]